MHGILIRKAPLCFCHQVPGSAFDAFLVIFFISSPFSYLSAAGDRLSGAVSSFTDVVDKRLISVARYSESGIDRYHLFAQPLINDYRIEPYVKPPLGSAQRSSARHL